MPIGHSPPSESTRSKTLIKSSAFADSQNQHSVSKPTQLNLLPANDKEAEPTLSWKEQCSTPTLHHPEIPTSTWIASAVTTTTSFSTTGSTSTLLLHRATTTVSSASASTMTALHPNRASPLHLTKTTDVLLPNSLNEITPLSRSGNPTTSTHSQYNPTKAVLPPKTLKETKETIISHLFQSTQGNLLRESNYTCQQESTFIF